MLLVISLFVLMVTTMTYYNIVDILVKLNITSSELNNNTKKIDTLLDTSTTKSVPVPLPTSRKEIKTKWPNSTSGGGWTRIAYLNMADSSANCPPGFRLPECVQACQEVLSRLVGFKVVVVSQLSFLLMVTTLSCVVG